MWRNFSNGGVHWNNKRDIQTHVLTTLYDLIAYAGLIGKVHAGQEASIFNHADFKSSQTNDDAPERADIWIAATDHPVPSKFPIFVGKPEVEQTGAGSGAAVASCSALADGSSSLICQMHELLMCVGTFQGLRWSFGVVTTYDEWRIWQLAAQCR